jgi:hypothetical protein
VVVKQEGGSANGNGLSIPVQAPAPVKLEQFAPGKVAERIGTSDARWSWKGPWEKKSDQWRTEMRSKTAKAEAAVSFEGTGAMLVGSLDNDRGMVFIFLDNVLMTKGQGPMPGDLITFFGEMDPLTIDGYNDNGRRDGEGLWGKFDINPGMHTLRVVVKGKPYTGSKDAWIYIQDVIVYRK